MTSVQTQGSGAPDPNRGSESSGARGDLSPRQGWSNATATPLTRLRAAPEQESSRPYPAAPPEMPTVSSTSSLAAVGGAVAKVTVGTLAYASTAFVATTTTALVADWPLGINTFQVLRSYPGFAAVGTAAHGVVIFLAASAGIGLARFRQSVATQQDLIDVISQTLDAHSHLIDKTRITVDPVVSLAQQLAEKVAEIQQQLADPTGFSLLSAEGAVVDRLCRSLEQLCVPFRFLSSETLQRSLYTEEAIGRIMTWTAKIPMKVDGIAAHLAAATELMRAMSTDAALRRTGIDDSRRSMISQVRELCSGAQHLVDSLTPSAGDDQGIAGALRIRLNIKTLLSDLQKLGVHGSRYREKEAALRKVMPRVEVGETGYAVRDLLEGIDAIYRHVLAAKTPPSTAEFAAIRDQAIRLQARQADMGLLPSNSGALDLTVQHLSKFTQGSTWNFAAELLRDARAPLDRVYRDILQMSPRLDPYAKFRIELTKRIERFSERYSLLAVRATVVGLVSSASYWMCCSELLESLLPSGGNLYDEIGIRAEHSKFLLPFVLWNAIVLAAGAVNHKYRPYVALASLELSALTFKMVAPFAWLYKGSHDLLDQVVDGMSRHIVRRRFRSRE